MGMLAEVMNEIAFDRGVEKGEERGIEKSRRGDCRGMYQIGGGENTEQDPDKIKNG